MSVKKILEGKNKRFLASKDLTGKSLLCLSPFILCKCCLHYKLDISPHHNIHLYILAYIGLAEVHITCCNQAHQKESH